MRVFKEGVLLALAVLLTLTIGPVTAEPPNDYPLHDAVWEGDLDRLVELLQTGYDPNEVDRYGQTALLCSARWASRQTLSVHFEVAALRSRCQCEG